MSSFVNGPNYLALPRNMQKWLIKDLLPSGGLANIYGKPKAKKSFVALHMAAAIANPLITEWQGFDVLQHGSVVYLQIDTPRTAWGDRMMKLTKLGLDFSEVYFADMQMVPTYPFNCLDPVQLKWLADELKRINPVLLIVDTIREAHNADENDSTVMRNVMTHLVSAALPVGAGVLFLSHQKKDSAFTRAGGDDLMDDIRGSSYVAGRMDNLIRLTDSRMTWKGRLGDGTVAVKWDDDLLAVVIDPAATKERQIVLRVVKEELAKDPKATKTAIGKALCAELGWDQTKLRTALRRLEEDGHLGGGK